MSEQVQITVQTTGDFEPSPRRGYKWHAGKGPECGWYQFGETSCIWVKA